MRNNVQFSKFYSLKSERQPLVFRISTDELKLLLARNLRGQQDGAVVWVDGDSETVIYPNEMQLIIQPGIIMVQLEFETDQTGRDKLIFPYFIGNSPTHAALISTTEEKPRGNNLLASRWGRIAQDAIWNALLAIGQERLDTRLSDSNLTLVGLYTDGEYLAYLTSPAVTAKDIADYFDALRDSHNGEVPVDIQPDPIELFPEVLLPEIRRLILVDVESGEAIKGYEDLQEYMVLDLNHLPTKRFSVLADTYPEQIGSVTFTITPGDYQQVQNTAPYFLMADEQGKIYPWQPDIGEYVITATPSTEINGRGEIGAGKTIRIRIVENQAMAITGFALLDANTAETLYDDLSTGTTINLAQLPTKKLALVAYTEPEQVGSVVFGLNNNAAFSIDNRSPYALYGDTNGEYNAWEPIGADYHISATPYRGKNGQGKAGATRSIRLRFVNKTRATITSLTLIDADNDEPIPPFDPIPDNATIDLSLLPTRKLNIRANTYPEAIGSVAFDVNGERVNVENDVPYALYGDEQGDYLGTVFEVDKYTIRATPYNEQDGQGEAGDALTVRFAVIDTPPAMAVVSFTLIDAAKDEPVRGYDPIREGAVISLNQLQRKQFNIRANVQGDAIKSVVFRLNDKPFGPDNDVPFSLFGDHRGKYHGEKLQIMTYNLQATPYADANGQGQAGISATLQFRVTQ